MLFTFRCLILSSLLIIASCGDLDGWLSLGCWRDLPTRAIASLEGRSKLLTGNWKTRPNALKACADAARNENLKVFAVQDGGQCFGGPYAQLYYDQYGPSNLCKGGAGGVWSNSVYSSTSSYRRVLQSKESQKPVKCSKPLDLVFLVDGSGASSSENKLRWTEMMRFIAKATELFDPASARFGVITYGSKPKTIVDLTKNQDEISMRDQIIGSEFPGGKSTVNDALKAAWQEQFKRSKGKRNKVIVALTTSNMDYGPWGSSLFLTNRGVRLLAFGVDKAPTYRYLESLASGRHPENIYALDSDQMDKTLPFLAKDICTGAKRSRVETVRKDKEIDLISSREFETVGSIIERPAHMQRSSEAIAQSDVLKTNTGKNQTNNAASTTGQENGGKVQETTHQSTQGSAGILATKEEEVAPTNATSEGGVISKYQTGSGNFMYEGSYQTKDQDVRTTSDDSKQMTSYKVMPIQEKASQPVAVNNSSLSDGDIVEKLKESAVQSLSNSDNYKSTVDETSLAPPQNNEARNGSSQSNKTLGGPLQSNDTHDSSLKSDVLNDSAQNKEGFNGSLDGIGNASQKQNETSQGQSEKVPTSSGKLNDRYIWSGTGYFDNIVEGNRPGNVSLGDTKQAINVKDREMEVSERKYSNDFNKSKESAGMKGQEAKSSKLTSPVKNRLKSEFDDQSPLGRSEKPDIQMTEGQMATPLRQRDVKPGHDAPKLTPTSNANLTTSNKGFSNESESKVSLMGDSPQTGSLVNNSSAVLKEEKPEFHNSENEKSDEDADKEVFDNLEKERQSIGEDDEGFETTKLTEDEQQEASFVKAMKNSKEGDDLEEDGKPQGMEPLEDETSLDEDERATQRALDQKRKEIDYLLKKLNETRKRRRKRKVLHRIKGFDDITGEDEKDFETFVKMDDKREEGGKNRATSMNARGRPNHHHRQKITYSKPVVRHLLTKLNNSNRDGGKKPFIAIPTTKAIRLLEKLYSTKHKANLTLKYDIFDPVYSSKGGQQMTRDNYKELLKHKTKSGGQNGVGKGVVNSKGVSKQPSDKQQMFLRHTIADKRRAPQAADPEKRNQVTLRRRVRLSSTSHNEFSAVNQKNQSDTSPWAMGQQKVKGARKAATGRTAVPFRNDDKESRLIVSMQNTTTNQEEINWARRNNIAKSKNVKISGKSGVNLSNFHFTTLSKIESGNYSIFKVSRHKILVNLQSTTGRLASFFGATLSGLQGFRPVDKGRLPAGDSKGLALHLATTAPLRAVDSKVAFPGTKAKVPIMAENIKPASEARFVDNLDYFQSSLATEPGTTRSVHHFKGKQRKKKHQKASRKHIGKNIRYSPVTERQENINRTRFDLYDNRLAHVDKPISYFIKNNKQRDPDRLIVTEKTDPITASRMVKLFVNAGDENSLMPAGSNGLGRFEGGTTKSMMIKAAKEEEFSDSDSWNKDVNAYMQAQGGNVSSGRQDLNGGAGAHKGLAKTNASGVPHEAVTHDGLMENGIRKIVETISEGAHERANSVEPSNSNPTMKGKNQRPTQRSRQNEAAFGNQSSASQPSRGNVTVSTARPSKTSRVEGRQSKPNNASQTTHADKKDDDVWVFKPDSVRLEHNYEEKHSEGHGASSVASQRNESLTDQGTQVLKTNLESNLPSKEKNSLSEETVASQLGQAVGCTRPVKALFLIDVSDAIGTGPTRQRKWNHMKRFLNSVKERVTHSGSMGYIVFDTEPRFLRQLEPCDQKTEYFVTSNECLCDHRAPSFSEGRSSCSTHAPTEDESVEDWGKQGPRTAKALQLAQSYFNDPMFGESKKLVVLITHQASTDDVSAAERSLKDDSISLVDIEIGERHNIRKRSNTFDDIIPRDHQMEVSFYKLDKAIENIYMKICKEKDPNKSRRSRIHATVKRHSRWW